MRYHSIGRQTEDRHLGPLKTIGPSRLLGMTIRGLEVELWEHPLPSAEAYARLIITPDLDGGTGPGQQELSDGRPIDAMLEPLQATALSSAIEQWLASLSGGIVVPDGLALFTTVAAVALALWNPTPGKPPKAEITLTGQQSLCATVTLTHVEAGLLATVLGSVLDRNDQPEE